MLGGITGLRALACLGIIFYHLNQLRSIDNLPKWSWDLYLFIGKFPIIVSFFFILTGMLISLKYWRSIFLNSPVPATRKLIIDRFFRIAPAYWAALFLSLFGVFLTQGAPENWAIRILGGFTFLSWAHPLTFFPVDINGPLWYISYDMMGGILVFAIMTLLTRVKKVMILPAFLITIAALFGLHFVFIELPFPAFPGILSEWFPVYNPFIFGIHFLIGAGIGALLIWWEKLNFKNSFWYDIGFLLMIAGLGYFLWDIREAKDYDYSWFHTAYRFPIAPLFIATIIVLITKTKWIGSLLDNPVFSFIAKISYSVYLLHALVIGLLLQLLFSNIAPMELSNWLTLSVLTIIITIPAAYGSWWLFEQKVTRWSLEKSKAFLFKN